MSYSSPQYRFIALLLGGRYTEARKELEHSAWNWELLARIAADNAIVPALDRRIQSSEIRAYVTTPVQEFFHAYAGLNTDRNLRLLAELESVAALLNESAIEPVVLKGVAYILTGVYPNPEERLIYDIDLLIPGLQIDAAEHLLRAQGFTPDVGDASDLARDHRPRLVNRDRDVSVELHHVLGPKSYVGLLPPTDVLRRSRRLQIGLATVRIPHPDDLLVHLVAHSQLKHSYDHRIWPPLRAQYDLLLLQRHLGADLNWAAIRERFRENGHAGLLDLHLLQVRDVLGLEIPYCLRLTALTRLRWMRRKLLWRLRWLRVLDPLYWAQLFVLPKLELASNLLKFPAGRRFLLGVPFRKATYRKIVELLSR